MPVAAMAQSASDFPVSSTTESRDELSGITPQNYPRVDGSASTAFLGQLIAARALNVPADIRRVDPVFPVGDAGGETVGISRNGALPVRLVFPLQTPLDKVDELLKLIEQKGTHGGTHQAYQALAEGRADMILVTRRPSADELSAARNRGMEFDVRQIALDAFVFIVNGDNPVPSLTLDQIRGIFSGSVRNWSEVGGGNGAIQPLARGRNSGSEELMKGMVMKDMTISRAQDRPAAGTMEDVVEQVKRMPDAIGYSDLFVQYAGASGRGGRLVAVEGVLPSTSTLLDGSYPLAVPVYVVTRRDVRTDAPAAKLRDWLLMVDGQQVAAASGLVPYSR